MLHGYAVCTAVLYGYIEMLQRLSGLILPTDKAKYFSRFQPSIILYLSVSFALYYGTRFRNMLRKVNHFSRFFHLPNKYCFASTCILCHYI
jgi:hypothetical protein